MGGVKPNALLLAGLAAAVACAPAHAQCRLCANPTTSLSQSGDSGPIELEIESSLNFDRLVLSGAGNGSAVVRPDGSSAAEGAVVEVSPRAMVGTALIHGAPDRTIRIELPDRIDLYSAGGGRLTVDSLLSDLPSLPKLDSAGNLTFRFGGRVTVTGDSEGDYRGDVPITVEYQ